MTVALPSKARSRRKSQERVQAAPLPVEIAVLTEAMTMIAIVCVWVALQLLVFGGLSYDRAQHLLYGEFRTDLAEATAPIGGVIKAGTPVSQITIPAIGANAVVVEGTASTVMLDAPGHRRDTVMPGQPGTAVVYGRASTYGAPFGSIADLRPGDKIEAITGQGKATYEVEGIRRPGDPLPQPVSGDGGRLVLVSAVGSGTLAAFSPSTTIYVDAKRTSAAFELGEARVAAVTPAEQPMGRDLSVLPLLTLVLAGCAAAVVAAAFAVRALGRVRAWTLMAAPVIALAWLATDVGMGLLPNLL